MSQFGKQLKTLPSQLAYEHEVAWASMVVGRHDAKVEILDGIEDAEDAQFAVECIDALFHVDLHTLKGIILSSSKD